MNLKGSTLHRESSCHSNITTWKSGTESNASVVLKVGFCLPIPSFSVIGWRDIRSRTLTFILTESSRSYF